MLCMYTPYIFIVVRVSAECVSMTSVLSCSDMLEHGYKLKTIVYNAFIKYYARHGDVQSE